VRKTLNIAVFSLSLMAAALVAVAWQTGAGADANIAAAQGQTPAITLTPVGTATDEGGLGGIIVGNGTRIAPIEATGTAVARLTQTAQAGGNATTVAQTTATAQANATGTAQASATQSAQATQSAGATSTASVNATSTASANATATAAPGATATAGAQATSTSSANATGTAVVRATGTASANATATAAPGATSTAGVRATGTASVNATGTAVVRATGTASANATSTAAPGATATAGVRATSTAIANATGTAVVRATGTASANATSTAAPGATATAGVQATGTAIVRATSTAIAQATGTARAIATATAAPGATATAGVRATSTAIANATGTAIVRATSTASAGATATAAPGATATAGVRATGTASVNATGTAIVRATSTASAGATATAAPGATATAVVRATGTASVNATGTAVVRATSTASAGATATAAPGATATAGMQATGTAIVQATGTAIVRATSTAGAIATSTAIVQATGTAAAFATATARATAEMTPVPTSPAVVDTFDYSCQVGTAVDSTTGETCNGYYGQILEYHDGKWWTTKTYCQTEAQCKKPGGQDLDKYPELPCKPFITPGGVRMECVPNDKLETWNVRADVYTECPINEVLRAPYPRTLVNVETNFILQPKEYNTEAGISSAPQAPANINAFIDKDTGLPTQEGYEAGVWKDMQLIMRSRRLPGGTVWFEMVVPKPEWRFSDRGWNSPKFPAIQDGETAKYIYETSSADLASTFGRAFDFVNRQPSNNFNLPAYPVTLKTYCGHEWMAKVKLAKKEWKKTGDCYATILYPDGSTYIPPGTSNEGCSPGSVATGEFIYGWKDFQTDWANIDMRLIGRAVTYDIRTKTKAGGIFKDRLTNTNRVWWDDPWGIWVPVVEVQSVIRDECVAEGSCEPPAAEGASLKP
jgi:hypothetical protein